MKEENKSQNAQRTEKPTFVFQVVSMLVFFCALLDFHTPICLPMLYNTITTTK